MVNDKTHNVAVIGAGYMAREHISAFQDIPGVKIAGISSRTRSKAETLSIGYGIPFVCDSIDELYDRTKAELVVVTVPELSANHVSRTCFSYPWVCLLEKPAGYNLADAESIISSAREKGARAFVALNRRFYSSTRSALSDLKQANGRRFIHVQDQEDQRRALLAGQPQTVVDNWMYANSIHLIDYFMLFGRGKITAVTPITPWDPKFPWVVTASIQYSSGDMGLYEGVWNAPGPWFVDVFTPEKRWEMRPLEQAAYQLAGERKMEHLEPSLWDRNFKPGLRLQAAEAISAVNGMPTELPTLEDSLKSMKLVHRIFNA